MSAVPRPSEVLWAHDHRFIPIQDEIYSEVQFEYTLWSRYLQHFDNLTVFARRGSIPISKNTHNLIKSSANGVNFRLQPNISSPSGVLRNRKRVRENLRAAMKRVDAVIARLPSEIGLLAVSEAHRAKIPVAIEVVGCAWDGYMNYGTYLAKGIAPIQFVRMRSGVRSAEYVTYVTEQFLQSRYPSLAKLEIGVSDVEINTLDERVLDNRLDRISSVSRREIVFGIIGSLSTKVKGIQDIIAALGKIKPALPDFKLRILGGGDQEPWRNLSDSYGLGGRVQFDGTCAPGEPVFKWLDDIDIYLQPSRKEGLPRALIEAMSRGCPAIGSRVAGIPELLDDDMLVKAAAPSQLAEAILNLATNEDKMTTKARDNWRKAENYLDSALSKRRNAFWSSFAEAAKTNRGGGHSNDLSLRSR